MIQLNDTLPEFTLDAYKDNDLTKVNLSDYTAKWLILLFYPADFTFVCPTELEDAADHYDQFVKNNAEMVSISTDTAYVHKAWHDSSKAVGKVTFPMLADQKGDFSRQMGIYNEEAGEAHRATFIIDPDQKVIAYEVHDNSIGRNIEEIFRKLEAAIYIRAHGGEVACPARWKPGQKTLKPGVELVGKI